VVAVGAEDTARATKESAKETARAGKKSGKELEKGTEDVGKGVKDEATKAGDASKWCALNLGKSLAMERNSSVRGES